MRPFRYTKANDAASAIRVVSANKKALYLSGGTNILDLMKEDVTRPDELVDINRRTPTPRIIRMFVRIIRCCRGRSLPARRSRSAIWRPTAAT
jgi:CO/xanthine dehydrogenase FAD-binding subunit